MKRHRSILVKHFSRQVLGLWFCCAQSLKACLPRHIKRLGIPVLLAVLACGSLFVLLQPIQPGDAAGPTSVAGTIITDTVWISADSPYVVTGDVTVNPGIKLQIEPGVQVAFDGNYALIVRGTLEAQGSSSSPIRFTSNQASPAAGDWKVLDFRYDSLFSVLDYAVIEYGGNSGGNNCLWGSVCVNTSSFTLNNSIVQHSSTRGLVLTQSDAVISNNTFIDNTLDAISLYSCNHNIGPCRPILLGNTFTNNASAIARHGAQDPYLSGNSASDNDINGLVLKTPCQFIDVNTWYADDLPYVIEIGYCQVGGHGEVSLNIVPGSVIKFGDGAGLDFKWAAVMTATGTIENPVYFTSLKDDTIGGDTNNDASASAPALRDWTRIHLADAGTQGTFEHNVFRYGGIGGIIYWGPLVEVNLDASLVMKHSDLSYSQVGVRVLGSTDAVLEENVFHDNQSGGVDISSLGDVLVHNNRFEDNDIGVRVTGGYAVLSDNFFEGNTTAVQVECNNVLAGCDPVISPHNSFVGDDQEGIVNTKPDQVCVQATGNWWGDESGPEDTSSALDYCDLPDNPGSGAYSSDGVLYSPWEGGLSRPLIARPACGLTGKTQPTFTGRSQDGATVSFYDGDTKLGQTVAGPDHTFSWIAASPLADGEHTITAIASLGGETSLPSPGLEMIVDSSLPFDPAGVQITYDLHGILYTQTLRDASGCASLTGDLSTPYAIRPGSIMTVEIPIRTDLVPGSALNYVMPLRPVRNESFVDSPTFPVEQHTLMIDYSSYSQSTVTHMLIASKDGEVIYGAYQFEDVDDMSPGDVRSILLDSGYYSILLLSGDNKIIDRWTVSLQSDDSILVSEQPQGMIEVIKPDEKEIKSLFLTQPIKGGEDRDWGGTLFSSGEPLKDRHYSLELPQGVYDIVMLDDEATFYFRRVDVTDSKIVNTLGPISSKPGTKLVITNNGKKDICRVYIRRSDDWAVSSDYPVDVLDYFEDAIGSNGGTLEFKVEPGTYDLASYDCDGKVVDVRNLVTIGGEPYPWTLVKPCENIGDVKIGETIIPIKCPTENQTNSTDATWNGCYASGQAEAGTMTISICVLNKLIEYIIGFILIDPDGYVYDAGVGFEALIQGATVTCDMYDEDYQTWSRWPAELYESQINPQVTGTDGYYAFFVPPGLYRVRAIAYGYDDHTSPDIRVINEVVHYNIPMTGGGGSAVLLPFVVR